MTRLKSASDIRHNMETYKLDLEAKSKEFVTQSVSNIYKEIEEAHKKLNYECAVRLGIIPNFENSIVNKMYLEAFTNLLVPLGYRFSIQDYEGIVFLNVYWSDLVDKLKYPVR